MPKRRMVTVPWDEGGHADGHAGAVVEAGCNGGVFEQVVQAGEDSLEVGDPDAHIWPASRARQYGRSRGR